MACGVPVISSDVGGLPEVNVDGKTGFIVKMGDVGALAQKTIELLTDENLHSRMSKAALAHAIENFTKEQIVPIYEAAYEKAMSI